MAKKANGIRTSKKMASKASKVLKNPGSSRSSKSLAGGILSNRGK